MDLTSLSGSFPNLLNSLLALGGLSISLRAFFLYKQLRSPRLFILGLAMGIVACTATADFTSGIVTSISLNTDWFLFLGQGTSFVFIFLSLLRSSDQFLRRLIHWQIISASLLFLLLILAPILPDFPNIATTLFLSGSRAVGCSLIFGYYITAFASKKTRFSFLMSISFVLLSIGYFLILPKYIFALPEGGSLDQSADMIRFLGFIALLISYAKG